jgi:flagellar operon protein
MPEDFRVQAARINGAAPQTAQPSKAARPAAGPSFAQTLASQCAPEIRFSNHAQKRLQTRDIQLSDENVNRLAGAIDKAEKRGGKSSLVLVDDLAFIVNVPDRLVVTALDAGHRGEGVFTQIDSVVFADPASQASNPRVDTQG